MTALTGRREAPLATQEGTAEGSFSQLTRESIIYATGSAIGKVVGFLMLPVLTRALTPAEYGRLDLLSTLGSAMTSALLLGLDVAVVRLGSDRASTLAERRRLYGSWTALALLVAVPAAVALSVFSPQISVALFGSDAWSLGVTLVGAITVFGLLQVIALMLLRIERRPSGFALVSAGSLILNALLTVLFLSTWRRDSTAALAALAVSLLVGALIGFTVLGWDHLGRPSPATARRILRLGLPLAPAVIVVWAGEFGNRSVLLSASGPGEVAMLGVALRFGSLIGLAVAGFQLAWQPRAYHRGIEPANLLATETEARRILIALAAAVVLVGAAAPEAVVLVAGGAYQPAVAGVGWILVAQLAAGVYLVTSMPSSLMRRFGHLAAASIVGVVVSITLNVGLARVYGSTGTAMALAAGQAVAAAIVWLLGRRVLRFSGRSRRALAIVVVAGVCAVVFTTPGIAAAPLVRVACSLVFLAVALAEGTLLNTIGVGTEERG